MANTASQQRMKRFNDLACAHEVAQIMFKKNYSISWIVVKALS